MCCQDSDFLQALDYASSIRGPGFFMRDKLNNKKVRCFSMDFSGSCKGW